MLLCNRLCAHAVEDESIGVSQDDRAIELGQPLGHFERLGAALYCITDTHPSVDRVVGNVRDDGIEGDAVAVDVRDDGDTHGRGPSTVVPPPTRSGNRVLDGTPLYL